MSDNRQNRNRNLEEAIGELPKHMRKALKQERKRRERSERQQVPQNIEHQPLAIADDLSIDAA